MIFMQETFLRQGGKGVDILWGAQTRTPETTKPPHFCGGFVLYGAAPRVEKFNKYMIFNIFFLTGQGCYL